RRGGRPSTIRWRRCAMSETHLRLRQVHRHYGEGEKMVHVLEAADLEVKGGELVAIVAPSGAGKSTLLHISGLLERPQQGEVEITGIATTGMSERGRTLLRRHTIGYVYQFHHLLPEFTALENVTMPQLIAGQGQREAERRGQELLELLGIGNRGHHRPAELSGGEQQRVAIARAAANGPRGGVRSWSRLLGPPPRARGWCSPPSHAPISTRPPANWSSMR